MPPALVAGPARRERIRDQRSGVRTRPLPCDAPRVPQRHPHGEREHEPDTDDREPGSLGEGQASIGEQRERHGSKMSSSPRTSCTVRVMGSRPGTSMRTRSPACIS